MSQFDVLSQIDSLLRPAGILFWLRGGWAIDFLHGRITRPHSDIDLVVLSEDRIRLEGVLTTSGFNLDRAMNIQDDFLNCNQIVSLVYLLKEGGRLFVEGIPEWEWLPDALDYPPQSLDGLTCRVLSPEQLLKEKVEYRAGTGRHPRPKDIESIRLLENFLVSPSHREDHKGCWAADGKKPEAKG